MDKLYHNKISWEFFATLGFCLLLLATAGNASDWSQADKHFAKGEYAKALESYTKARLKAGDDRRLNLNLGTTLYKLERYTEAGVELQQATGSLDSSIAASAYYNMANVLYRLGQKSDEPSDRIAKWREAIALNKKAVDLRPGHDKAKRNAEFIGVKLKEELDKQKKNQQNSQSKDTPLSEEAKKALARAMQLVAQGRYKDAKVLLEKTIEADPTVQSLSDEVQRVQDLLDLSEGREPSAPVDASQSTKDLQVI